MKFRNCILDGLNYGNKQLLSTKSVLNLVFVIRCNNMNVNAFVIVSNCLFFRYNA